MGETVVKCSLRAALAGDKHRAAVESVIERIVRTQSALWRLGTANFSLLIAELFAEAEHVADADLPALNNTTIRQMMVRWQRAYKPVPQVQAFYERHPELEEPLTSLPAP
jgi:hypothetical protein